MEWKKIFTNHILDGWLISKMHKEFIWLNSKEKNPNNMIFKNWQRTCVDVLPKKACK